MTGGELGRCSPDQCKSLLARAVVFTSCCCECQPARQALEERASEKRFELAHLLGNRPRSDVQFPGRDFDAEATRCCFEEPDRSERRQTHLSLEKLIWRPIRIVCPNWFVTPESYDTTTLSAHRQTGGAPTAMNAASLVRLFLLAALWGGSFLFMRIAAPVLGAVPTAFGRVVLGAAGLLGLIALMRVPAKFRGMLIVTFVLGAINSGIPFLMFSMAARALPAGYSAILNATTPLMGVLIGVIGFGERLTWAKAAGVLIGLAGVAVLTRTGPVEATATVLWGVAACLVATACYGLAGYLTKRWITQRGGLDSRIVALGSQIGAVLLLLPFAAWEAATHPIAWHEVGTSVWISMLVLGLFCTSLAYVLYFRLIADVGPRKAMTVTFLIPLFGVLWGWLVLGESASLAYLGVVNK